GIACALVVEGELPVFAGQLATAVYRIVQEALTNVVRHAAADQVNIGMRLVHGSLEVMVEDNGRGFAPAALAENSGLGLAGMRERAALIGGRLEVVSEPGRGARIVLRAPLFWGDLS
ncbi:MAG: ATP-binding protein, partial [Deltaproteobacteria bacterium]|nr:ATP-binding protein [Deltaproteobacteria bacterium]